ncbi:hypothetical protein ACH5AO_09855 [Streptomyces sp. NPDC018964]|uniref:hypothetical protein n=1 Tax=unclassified Streptomyces TaxID=2593676 RepID=UPI00379152B6
MITSAVRGVAVTTLAATLALFPTLAHAAEEKDEIDTERVELLGISRLDTWPAQGVSTGDAWTNHLDLYAKETAASDGKDAGKKKLRHVGDGQSECVAVKVQGDEVTAQCTRVLRMANGTLTLSDMIRYSPPEQVTSKTAITGGTGHYRSAYGDGYITIVGRHIHLVLNVDE